MNRADPIETGIEILRRRYAGADSAFVAGSVMRGDATAGRTALNERVKARANALLEAGPPTWSAADIDYWRYTITGLLDDLVEPRNAPMHRGGARRRAE